MPLAGTKREQKHYREIRKEYPEKGKEYAARVARNIVRANTPGGRKLKGTTEYGRTWGPPYSEPLSKQSYYQGVHFALDQLGFNKEAGIREQLLRLLEGPHGELAIRIPVQASKGAIVGGATGAFADHGSTGALIGGLSGAAGGAAIAAAPRIRAALIRRLARL